LITVEDLAAIHAHMTDVARSSWLHGERHWRDVARVGTVLLAEGVDADRDVLLVFAPTHDSQRHNDGRDPDHGERASRLIQRLCREGTLALADGQLELAVAALAEHDRGKTTDHPTVGACWDADRLTLWRIGKTPRVKFFSTEAALRSDFEFIELGKRIVEGPDLEWDEIVDAYRAGTATDVLGP
jgi:uncharacterized protein